MPSSLHEIKKLLDEIREQAKHNAIIARAADRLALLCRGHFEGAIPASEFDGLGLTYFERRFCDVLFSKPGATLTKHALLDAVYFDRDEPQLKCVDIFISKIRRKLDGSRFAIQTVWGVGFRGEVQPCLPPVSAACGAQRASGGGNRT